MHGEAFRGYIASKRRYFYGLRVHLVSTASREPVEFTLAAASEPDLTLFKQLKLKLPERAIICADKGYTDYHYEKLLEDLGLHLKAQRKKNTKRPMPLWEEFWASPSPVHRDGLQQAERDVCREDPCRDAQGL